MFFNFSCNFVYLFIPIYFFILFYFCCYIQNFDLVIHMDINLFYLYILI